MAWIRPRDRLDWAFTIAVVLKGIDGVLELLGGAFLLFVRPEDINRAVTFLTRHELSEDPHDRIAHYLLGTAHGLTGRTLLFAAVYLLSHGIVKIVLVLALLRQRYWAYPWMIWFLLLFIAYQLYRIAVSPTVGLIALTIFDAVVVWLTWREYRRRAPGGAPPRAA